MNRNVMIAGSVIVLHVAALWALQSGLLRRTTEVIVPVQILSEFVEPAQPRTEAAPPVLRPRPQAPRHSAAPAPRPLPPTTAEPATDASAHPPLPIPAPAPQHSVPAPMVAAGPPATATPPPAPPRVDLPSSNADYLHNPKPAYPALSKRLGEQGKVVVRVLIGADGTAREAVIQTSSGYERLDQVALATVLRWRYVPGRRNGVPETMWFNVPIHFVLE